MGNRVQKQKAEPARTAEDIRRGQRIRALRNAKEWNQVEFAAQIGLDQSTISDIENGAGFSADVLMRMADALGASPHYVMRGVDLEFWPFQHIAVHEFIGLDAQARSLVEGRLMEYLSLAAPPQPPQPQRRSSHRPAVSTQRKRRA